MNRKIAIVTGASSGIGEVTAEQLVRAGYKVYGSSRSGAQGQSGKRTFEMLTLDVTSDESVAAAVNQVLRLEGRIDLLVNNAGFGVAPAAAEESSIRQAQAIFDTNFFGAVRMIRAVVPHMRQRGSGRIVNISSVLGFVPMPYMALYSATKHAMEGYSESLDQELRTQGIRVSLVEPAYIKSAFDANQLQPDEALDEYRDLRAGLDLRVKEALEGADGPGVVAETVVQVALAATPKVRYTSGALAGRLRFLRRFAPAALVEAGVRKDLRLDSQPALRKRATALSQ
ncbi:short-subunit dehydrogenase [Collimonas sp. PA-H2]|uniref:oxidoreductase n=1 Tax=Collimonas sp. PA-H2 TaxID=1881062 RepID=UPI000BF5DBA7|nr:oxidoreductase [Collimonas sp. PA-H2]PFH12414.1 short-subunit dehydrogenase [Collimonas sp. PA-H2]